MTLEEKRKRYVIATQKWRSKKTPEFLKKYDRNINLKKLYGITLKDYEIILQKQGNGCAVCNGPPLGKSSQFHVDHSHETGKIRGILCHFCNIALGMVRDDVGHLQKLINYLNKN